MRLPFARAAGPARLLLIFSGGHMRHRSGAFIGLIALVVSLVGPVMLAQTRTAKPWSAPRTPDGKPDLQGNWSFATITPFERTTAFGDKAVVTDQEVAEFEKKTASRTKQDDKRHA